MPRRQQAEPEEPARRIAEAAEREQPGADEASRDASRPVRATELPLGSPDELRGAGHGPVREGLLLAQQMTRGNAYVQRALAARAGRRQSAAGSPALERQEQEEEEVQLGEPVGTVPGPGSPEGMTGPGAEGGPASEAVAPPGEASAGAEAVGGVADAAEQAGEAVGEVRDVATEIAGEVMDQATGVLSEVTGVARELLEEREGTEEELERLDQLEAEAQTYISMSISLVLISFDVWAAQASFSDIKIMSLSAIGYPGCLSGPPLVIPPAPAVGARLSKFGPALSAAITSTVTAAFQKWADGVMVPGLPWYPAFAAWAGPMAPPMPNVPSPLSALPSSGVAGMTPGPLLSDMLDSYGGGKDPDGIDIAILHAVATSVGLGFMSWLGRKQVMNVLGFGPVPTYAPPIVLVGPVLAGETISVPGQIV